MANSLEQPWQFKLIWTIYLKNLKTKSVLVEINVIPHRRSLSKESALIYGSLYDKIFFRPPFQADRFMVQTRVYHLKIARNFA